MDARSHVASAKEKPAHASLSQRRLRCTRCARMLLTSNCLGGGLGKLASADPLLAFGGAEPKRGGGGGCNCRC